MIKAKQLTPEEVAKIAENRDDYASRNTIGDLLGHIAWLEQQNAKQAERIARHEKIEKEQGDALKEVARLSDQSNIDCETCDGCGDPLGGPCDDCWPEDGEHE
ncbi:hypothetical protein CIG75_19140 [Tumebacillus algifaecis]|uniref:Uncharacterized protein n=1 Tax=Tumebacillus algifaecis TaxID=1214604 RepID=A0A223D5G9_9BACL|nr:hypothetical protein [Tumebacillus algifaecis]ASS76849.1 hypothetical protein CIG75_19140 [Tumebacillus algifaecis]